jgi:xanthine dehydrogenase accessory factor
VQEVLQDVRRWAERGERIAVATVVAVRRSAPRPPGAKLAVSERGEIAGAVTGGCVESAVVQAAEELLRGGPPRLLRFGIADDEAFEIGLPCGGEVEVFVAVHAGAAQLAFAQAAADGGRAALVTRVAGAGAIGAQLLVRPDGPLTGSLGDDGLDALAVEHAEELLWHERSALREVAGETLFVDVTAPSPRLLVFGAIDYSAALCRLARLLGWRPFVCDPRATFATPARFPDAEELVVAWPQEAIARLGGIDAATSVVVLTHDPKLDDAALLPALRSPAAYVGAMGSRRVQAARRERLAAAGLERELLDRLAAPIGLDLGAATAEETAVSIMAEIVAVRRGRGGGRLCEREGRIHEAVG